MIEKHSHSVTDCHRMAISYLKQPPDPRLSVLAIGWYEKALELEPNNVETYLGLAKAYHRQGQTEEALACCERAITLEPESLAARYVACMLQLPILYRTEEEIALSRQQYREHLLALKQRLLDAPPQVVADLAEMVGTFSPFYLIYQGYNDTELQSLYGEMVCDIMAARYPQWSYKRANKRQLPLPAATAPLRIGIVFGHFRNHSVWKVIVKGWLKHLNQERFQLFGYSLGTKQDQETEIARKLLNSYIDGARFIEEWGQLISADRPHILLYPEVSMHKVSIQLSALRLAPIQCTTWGTYVTSGLPTMNYHLSGERLEPSHAQQHYTEELIQLPHLSIHYTPLPVITEKITEEKITEEKITEAQDHKEQTPVSAFQRSSYGLRSSSVIYLCLQSLFKYLPQYDHIYPQIAKAVSDCQFVFLKHKSSEALTRLFEDRLRQAFSAAGLDMDQFVVMQPTLSDAAYQQLNAIGDVFLDSIGVAGTTTTLEAIAHNLPIVTMPSEFLRGRVSSAILKQMGVTSTVVTSVEHYIETAIRLGQSATWRQAVAAQIAQNKHCIYGDMDCIDTLENNFATFLKQMCVA